MKYEEIVEAILTLLKENDNPVPLSDIAKKLGFKSDSLEYTELKNILKDLSKQKLILKHSRRRYSLEEITKDSTFVARIKIINDNGFVELNKKIGTVYIKRKDLNTALDGDLVKVRLLPFVKGKKKRAEVIDIIERNDTAIAGTVEKDGDFYFLIPDEQRHYIDFLIPKNKLADAKLGDKVIAKLIHWNDPSKSPQVEVIKKIGKAGEPKIEFDSFIKEFDIKTDFPAAVLNEIKQFKDELTSEELTKRLDLRDKLIITIDPEDAKDFDDAISVEDLPNGNLLLGVHIADVSYYVREGTALDSEAFRRATSIYLADRVVPMLPERLSNELCSLQPNKDRLAFSVFMEFTPRGVLKNYELHQSIINSKRRYTYDEVQEIIDKKSGDNAELILKAHKLATILKERRLSKGGINFETFEIKFKLDSDKTPLEAKLKIPTEATSLIEEFMLAANQSAANYVKKLARKQRRKILPYIFRVHDEPDPRQIRNALQFIRTLVPIGKIKDVTSRELNSILSQFINSNEKYIVNNILIRSMAKAIYSSENIGHYGLGFKEYTHFTSPIRRYPDLVVHRLIKEYLNNKIDDIRYEWLAQFVNSAARQSSEMERLSVELERESVKLASIMLAKNYVGDIFQGVISGVTSFGLFVLLDEIYAEGLLHIRDIYDDFYYLDEKRYCLIGRHTGKIFRIGKKVNVRILKADVLKRRLDLAYIQNGKNRNKKFRNN